MRPIGLVFTHDHTWFRRVQPIFLASTLTGYAPTLYFLVLLLTDGYDSPVSDSPY